MIVKENDLMVINVIMNIILLLYKMYIETWEQTMLPHNLSKYGATINMFPFLWII